MKTISKDQKLIRKTRRKIIIMTTAIVGILFIALEIGYATYLNLDETNNRNISLDLLLAKPIDENISNPDQPTDGGHISFERQRGFLVKIDVDKNISFYQGNEAYSSFVTTNLESLYNNSFGNIDDLYYKSKNFSAYKIVAGVDRSIEINSIQSTIFTSSLAFVSAILIVLVLSVFLSRMILKPIQASQKNQKEFINNASHELKTPLTIIDANASILKSENIENKWINNILIETKNMNNIIVDMLNLASVEENSIVENFDLTASISNVALSFDAFCFENNIKYITNIDENIILKGNKKDVEKIIKILLDNAIKYVSKNGRIELNLTKNNNSIVLSVCNTGCNLKDSNRNKIFNRFYRDEISRDSEKTQGSGLGLSILKEICDKYHYKNSIDSKENEYFKIVIKLK